MFGYNRDQTLLFRQNMRELIYSTSLWLCYIFIYKLTDQVLNSHLLNSYFALIWQVSLDLLCAYYALRLAANHQRLEKAFFMLIGSAFCFSALGDITYNVILGILNIKKVDFYLNSLFHIPYAIFLSLEFLAWFVMYILLQQYNPGRIERKLYIPFAIITGITTLSFILIIFNRQHLFQLTSAIFNNIDSVIELFTFTFLVISLFSSKTKSIGLLASGYLIMIAIDFVFIFSTAENTLFPGSIPETIWILGQSIFLYGLILLHREKTTSLRENFNQWNSLNAQLGYWTFTLSMFYLLILIVIGHVFGDMQHVEIRAFPMALIAFSVASALISRVLSHYLTKPFKHLSNIFSLYNSNETPSLTINSSNSSIEEFRELEKYLYDGLAAIEAKQLAEKAYMTKVLDYANQIRNPTVAIKMAAEDLQELPEFKREMLTKAADKITLITQMLLQSHAQISAPKVQDLDLAVHNQTAILVDDNKNLCLAWELEAEAAGIKLEVFHNAQDFKAKASSLAKTIPLYIDVNLVEQASGVELAKWAQEQGFSQIHLITGGDITAYSQLTWLKGVGNKMPPFKKTINLGKP